MREFLAGIIKLPFYVAVWLYAMFDWVFYILLGLVGLYGLLRITANGLEFFFTSDFVDGYGHILGMFLIIGIIFMPVVLLDVLFCSSKR